MATPKQIEANRRNALASTGPKTQVGKLASSRNALKHGFLSKAPLVPGEDESMFEKLRARFWEELNPIGICEQNLVERIVCYKWRLRRIAIVEAYMFAPQKVIFSPDKALEESLASSFIDLETRFGTLSRYEVCLERMMAHAFQELRFLQANRTATG